MKHPKDLVGAARQIIAQVPYITIASVSAAGEPWNTPVFSAYDEVYHFYFSTNTESHKARNIANNGKVFLVIYDSTAPVGTGVGVYIQGSARLLTNDAEKRRAYDILVERRQPVELHAYDAYEIGPYGLYEVVPERVFLNTESSRRGHYVDRKQEIILRD